MGAGWRMWANWLCSERKQNAPKTHGDMLGAKDLAKQGQKGGIGMAGWDFRMIWSREAKMGGDATSMLH